jgi:type II secretory pathway pseudopilin PulG
MEKACGRAGATLVDLVVSLAILSVVSTIAAPRLGAARDAWAAGVARDATIVVITRARTQAVVHGSARLALDPAASTVAVEAPIGVPNGDVLYLGDTWGVALSVDHANGPVRIDFDGLGLGRLASRTLRFSRGGAEARVSLSTYGRPRRW